MLSDEKIINPQQVDKIYVGSNLFRYLSLSAIIQQFSDIVCSPYIPNLEKSKIYISKHNVMLDDLELKIYYEKNNNDFKIEVDKCFYDTKTRFIVIYISLLNNNTGHANIIIVDKQLNTFIIYDPNGSKLNHKYNDYTKTDIINHIQRFLSICSKKLIYYKHCNWLPAQKLETLEIEINNEIIKTDGLCLTHTLYFIWIFFTLYTNSTYSNKQKNSIITNISQKLPDSIYYPYYYISTILNNKKQTNKNSSNK